MGRDPSGQAKLNFYICRQIKRRVGKLVAAQWAQSADSAVGQDAEYASLPLDAFRDC